MAHLRGSCLKKKGRTGSPLNQSEPQLSKNTPAKHDFEVFTLKPKNSSASITVRAES
jgi:hypothetical protein